MAIGLRFLFPVAMFRELFGMIIFLCFLVLGLRVEEFQHVGFSMLGAVDAEERKAQHIGQKPTFESSTPRGV